MIYSSQVDSVRTDALSPDSNVSDSESEPHLNPAVGSPLTRTREDKKNPGRREHVNMIRFEMTSMNSRVDYKEGCTACNAIEFVSSPFTTQQAVHDQHGST
jgi:hypothetical protein